MSTTLAAATPDWRMLFGEQALGGAFIDAAPAPAPLHYLTILFSDLSSSVGLSAQLTSPDYVELLRRLRSLYRYGVARHGGVIARLQGDGMLAVFGQQGRSDDDGLRAIHCALELHGRVQSIFLGERGQSCAALHSGIFAGFTHVESGDLERGRFDLVGSAPSLAARLSALADRDGILTTEQVIAPHLDEFFVSERRTLQVKGWPEPVFAYGVLGRTCSWSAAPADVRFSVTHA